MTLRHLRIFAAVCECGSATRAAEQLYISQPAVSLAIRELEEYYGVRLFDRLGKRLYLTEAGQRLQGYALHVRALFDEIEKGIRDWEAAGTLRIGASITVGTSMLPGWVKRFSQEHPGLRVRCTVDNSGVIEGKLFSNELDFALIEGSVHGEQICSLPFRRDRLRLVCAPEHPFAARAEILPEELRDQPLLMREKGSGARELLESALLTLGLSVEPAWESISTRALINGVRANLGVAVLPEELVRQELQRGVLCAPQVRGLSFQRELYIIYHRDKYLSPTAQAFIAMCREAGKDEAKFGGSV